MIIASFGSERRFQQNARGPKEHWEQVKEILQLAATGTQFLRPCEYQKTMDILDLSSSIRCSQISPSGCHGERRKTLRFQLTKSLKTNSKQL